MTIEEAQPLAWPFTTAKKVLHHAYQLKLSSTLDTLHMSHVNLLEPYVKNTINNLHLCHLKIKVNLKYKCLPSLKVGKWNKLQCLVQWEPLNVAAENLENTTDSSSFSVQTNPMPRSLCYVL